MDVLDDKKVMKGVLWGFIAGTAAALAWGWADGELTTGDVVTALALNLVIGVLNYRYLRKRMARSRHAPP